MPKPLAILALIVLVGAAAVWLFLPHDAQDTATELSAPAPAAPATADSASTPPTLAESGAEPSPAFTATPDSTADQPVRDDVVPPPLHLTASDATVLAAVTQLSPDVVQWLLPDDQIRKWVATINLLAEGKFPVKDRPLEVALPPFQVRTQGEILLLERNNYRRASALVKALTEMPPSRVARHYEAWRPLLEQAQEELGNGKQFDERLHTAIARVLAVQPLTGEIELKAGVLKYTYADDQLEKASALEKALWRLGPSNTLRIQNFLRHLQPLL